MSSLQCVGTSSKVPAKDTEAVKPGVLSSRDAPVNKSVQSKTQRQKPKPSTWPDGQQIRSSAITERRRDNGIVDRSETHVGLQAPSPVDTTTHRQEKSPRRTAPAGAEEKTVSAECAQKMREAVVQVPRYLGVPKRGTGRSTSEAESRGEEECEEEDEDADEFRAPIELLAEFLKAVMERNYTLCKKLCQMSECYCMQFITCHGEGGGAVVHVSHGEGGVAFVHVSHGEGGVAFVHVSHGEGGVAFVHVSHGEGGVAFVHVSHSEGGVASVFVSHSEGGVASVFVSHSEGGVASVFVSHTEGGVAFIHVSHSEGGMAFVHVSGWSLCLSVTVKEACPLCLPVTMKEFLFMNQRTPRPNTSFL
ncbi:glutamate-rich protein 2 isoform X2 [Ictalurus furcatus]|uniref:glutamate-rich protein 2 isoform X2 n=1 Tax=Ictalurus furcatus TaxID=66913 RepID=UPI002350F2F5|nr:glutamate-rich protein 2 isoform X2 [Ictalurus furcatus]